MNKISKKSTVDNPRSLVSINESVGAVIIGGHFQGLGLLRSLGEKSVPIYLLDTIQCIGRFSKYVKKFYKCPQVKEESRFLEFLTNMARKENLTGWVVYPNDDETACFLAKYRKQLEEYYTITTPPWETYQYAYDKMSTYKLAEKHRIAMPKTYYYICMILKTKKKLKNAGLMKL